MKLRKTLTACVAAGVLAVPGAAIAHDGGGTSGTYSHHRHVVVLSGTVNGTDTDSGTVNVQVAKANRSGHDLENKTVVVKVVKGWVADTNNDGKISVADVQPGDKVVVFTKRRFVNTDNNTVSAAFLIDKTHPKESNTDAYRAAYRDGSRDGRCDHS